MSECHTNKTKHGTLIKANIADELIPKAGLTFKKF